MSRYSKLLLCLLVSLPLITAQAESVFTTAANTKPITQSDIQKLLPGNWTVVLDIDGREVKSVTTYNKNNTVQYNLSIAKGKEKYDHQGKGKWRIEGNTIIVEVIESNADYYLQVGDILKYQVVHIDNKKLTYRDDQGTEATEQRF